MTEWVNVELFAENAPTGDTRRLPRQQVEDEGVGFPPGGEPVRLGDEVE
jgi:hypothetical protein